MAERIAAPLAVRLEGTLVALLNRSPRIGNSRGASLRLGGSVDLSTRAHAVIRVGIAGHVDAHVPVLARTSRGLTTQPRR